MRLDVSLAGARVKPAGVSVHAFLEANPKFRSPLYKAPHAYAGNNADMVAAIAPYITKTRGERMKARLASFVRGTKAAAQKTPHLVVNVFEKVREEAPVVAQRVKEDVILFRELRAEKKRASAAKKSGVATMDAAAEE